MYLLALLFYISIEVRLLCYKRPFLYTFLTIPPTRSARRVYALDLTFKRRAYSNYIKE